MNNKGVAIAYADIATGAKENFKPSVEGETVFSDVSVLSKNDVPFVNYGNPCELYSVLLDGNSTPFPSDTSNKVFGVWSNEVSNELGYFETPVLLEFYSSELFTTSGITLSFDLDNEIFPIEVIVRWYRGEEKIVEETFHPTSAKYFFNKKVEYYDGITFEFLRINMPHNRLKIRAIDYGIDTVFYGDELRKAKIIQELDPISTEISINTCDFSIDSKQNIEFTFQTQQPIFVTFNGELKSVSFVKSAKRKSKTMWDVQSEDYIGLMDTIPFYGGIYQNKNPYDLIEEIFRVAKIPYIIDSSVVSALVSGYIPYTTCREALMQVCFAIGAVVRTGRGDAVEIFSLSEEVSQIIPKSRILTGQSFTEKTTVTAVELVSHSYKMIDEETTVYDASKNGVGNNITVIFNEPIHALNVTNGSILESGTNYAVINARENCLLVGKKYEHTTTTKTKRNPLISSSDIENIVAIQNATLISQTNDDKVLLKCYNYIVNSREISTKIVDGKHIVDIEPVRYGQKKYGEFKYGQTGGNTTIYDKSTFVGDIVIVGTEFLGDIKARIIKQDYSLVGGITVKNTILR